jgi:hypothetical protein
MSNTRHRMTFARYRKIWQGSLCTFMGFFGLLGCTVWFQQNDWGMLAMTAFITVLAFVLGVVLLKKGLRAEPPPIPRPPKSN